MASERLTDEERTKFFPNGRVTYTAVITAYRELRADHARLTQERDVLQIHIDELISADIKLVGENDYLSAGVVAMNHRATAAEGEAAALRAALDWALGHARGITSMGSTFGLLWYCSYCHQGGAATFDSIPHADDCVWLVRFKLIAG